MSSLYERDGRYYVQFTDRARDPAKRRFSLNTNNARTAARAEAAARLHLLHQLTNDERP